MQKGFEPARPLSVYPNRAGEAPRLLVELEPWPRVFFRNLFDAALGRDRRGLPQDFRTAPFWPDVFVESAVPKRSLTASAIYHAALVAVLYSMPAFLLFVKPRPVLMSQAAHQPITYYDIGDYLPPVNTGSAPAKVARTGRPAFAKQPIISTPDDPDNLKQTIIDPDHPLVLHEDVKLPNVVIWTDRPAPPVAANVGQPRLAMPVMAAEVVPPAPDASGTRAHLEMPKLPDASVVAPSPPADPQSSAILKMPNLPSAAVVEPPPADAAQRNIGQLNIGKFDPQVAAPALPMPVQRASGVENTGRMAALTRATPGAGAAPPPVPSAPSASAGSGGSGVQAASRLIALGLEPAAVAGPIVSPGGNRRGEFAAGPTGTPGAPGTPDISGGGDGHGGTGSGTQGGLGNGTGAIPAGIYVGPGPAGTPTAQVTGTGSPQTPPIGARRNASVGQPSTRQVLMAAMSRPKLTDLAPDHSPGTADPTAPSSVKHDTIEDSVFGNKKYYSMILNMPNLTSAGGSWIIRFAELHDTNRAGELTAPVAIIKVDPAYPSEAIRNKIEGTVVLYAVIRSDGTVGAVRVLRGVEQQLDANACEALLHWHFRPATKNGAPVDLESVVQIPFAIRKSSGF